MYEGGIRFFLNFVKTELQIVKLPTYYRVIQWD